MNLLDTDTASYFLKGYKNVQEKLNESLLNNEELFISTISVFEIKSGLYHRDSNKQLAIFNNFISKLEVLNLSDSSRNFRTPLCEIEKSRNIDRRY